MHHFELFPRSHRLEELCLGDDASPDSPCVFVYALPGMVVTARDVFVVCLTALWTESKRCGRAASCRSLLDEPKLSNSLLSSNVAEVRGDVMSICFEVFYTLVVLQQEQKLIRGVGDDNRQKIPRLQL